MGMHASASLELWVWHSCQPLFTSYRRPVFYMLYCESPATTMNGRIWCLVTSPFCTYGSAFTNASISSGLEFLRQRERAVQTAAT